MLDFKEKCHWCEVNKRQGNRCKKLLSMPDSSPHSRTHLGNFCTMSIWFLLPLNLPVSDPEKVQVKNRGRNQDCILNQNVLRDCLLCSIRCF
ncbi:hypothetical protein Y1Q_0002315 [Alligator mississippiensis]|uniref:Uncharacterized protein n=1 Tax=Alligator mississippiensis TaxID=8496 RepID=A0A151MGQ2_ALLMI|nr:hypothetical protein Y1Q_0002315 [Alligator mississippiensis]